jgi:hypothetical protein
VRWDGRKLRWAEAILLGGISLSEWERDCGWECWRSVNETLKGSGLSRLAVHRLTSGVNIGIGLRVCRTRSDSCCSCSPFAPETLVLLGGLCSSTCMPTSPDPKSLFLSSLFISTVRLVSVCGAPRVDPGSIRQGGSADSAICEGEICEVDFKGVRTELFGGLPAHLWRQRRYWPSCLLNHQR